MIKIFHPTVKSKPLELNKNKDDIEKLVIAEYNRKAKERKR